MSQPQKHELNTMDTKPTARNLFIVIFLFTIFAQALYTHQNVRMFERKYTRQTNEQVRELGNVIRNEISTALKYNIPLERLGRVNIFLKSIVDDTPTIAFIDIIKENQTLFSAARERDHQRIIDVPIANGKGVQIAVIRLGISQEINRQSVRILFDLFTIVMVGLIITYELLIFFTSRMLHIPGQETHLAANCLLSNLKPFPFKINSRELSFFLFEMNAMVENIRQWMDCLESCISKMAKKFTSSTQKGRENILEMIHKQKKALAGLTQVKIDFKPIIDPAHVRPLVFVFILAANLHACFLPFYAKELLIQPTFLSGKISEKILMALPITGYMITVTVTMLFLGSSFFIKVRPFRAIAASLLFTIAGLILCGLAQDILILILARMMCAVGFALIVLYGRQFIVDHSLETNRAFYLAGYTTAFSGGLFCSIVFGGIMADYFSYRIVFFSAAAMMIFVFIFAYLVFADYSSSTDKTEKDTGRGLGKFIILGIKDRNLLAIMAHGVVTRIMLVGFYYYCIPIFLKTKFAYSDIGRIMMFYALTNIFMASFLNKYVKKVKQSKTLVVISNVVLGIALTVFYFCTSDSIWFYSLAAIGSLIILGLSNILTFPSQVNLLLDTKTAREIGNRTSMAVYQSVERIGSALGPLVFGYFATFTNIEKAIGMGGMICLAANVLFLFTYGKKRTI